MGIHDKNTVPKRPWNVAPPGGLVQRRYTKDAPLLVVDSYPVFGNKFHDNTAPHWYWVYLVYDSNGTVPYKEYASNWQIFDA